MELVSTPCCPRNETKHTAAFTKPRHAQHRSRFGFGLRRASLARQGGFMKVLSVRARRARHFMRAALGVGVFCVGAILSAGETGGGASVVRVEEDWRLEVVTPDPGTNAPQISCVFAPTADIDFGYAEFDINHHSLPRYRPGGMQLQVWSNNQPIVVNNDPDGGIFSNPEETVTWTQSLAFDDGVLTFAIRDGQSDTWGRFGHDNRLKIATSAPIDNLNGYDTAVSKSNSGIGFASNRVRVLKITAVRRYYSDGTVSEDATPHVDFPHD